MKQILIQCLLILCASLAGFLTGEGKAQASFACGPNYITYQVRSMDGRVGSGVRCVLFGIGSAQFPTRPMFTWYGEGRWGNVQYRHIGHVFYISNAGSSARGYAADIYGNGENAGGVFNGNIYLERTPEVPFPNTIYVRGAWAERWDRIPNGVAPYTSTLPRVTRCGRNFAEYHVEDRANQPRPGGGVRCVLRYAPAQFPGMTWYGDGFWYRSNYAHVGTFGLRGFGASDLCEPSKYQICGAAPYGSLQISRVPYGFEVRGNWAEAWLGPAMDLTPPPETDRLSENPRGVEN